MRQATLKASVKALAPKADAINSSRSKPYDWVMPSPNLRSLQTSVDIGTHSFAHGLVVDTRVYTPVAELAPALMNDSGGSNMQHMAVVEDFLLP